MSNDFINEDNQTLENSETGDPSQIENETQGSTEQAQESIRYMQSEKDKAMAENAKLRQEIESIKDHLASSTQKDNRVDINLMIFSHGNHLQTLILSHTNIECRRQQISLSLW